MSGQFVQAKRLRETIPAPAPEENRMESLAQMTCTACRKGEPTVTESEISEFQVRVPETETPSTAQ